MERKLSLDSDFSRESYTTKKGYTLLYRRYVPKDYDFGKYYPLVIFLHGAGERGCDNQAQIEVALPHMFDSPDSPAYQSMVIAPQCPEDKQWVYTPWSSGNYSVDTVRESAELEAVADLIRYTVTNYNIDRSRIYVTGLSMGGFGSWDLLMRHNRIFAAGLICCGGGDPSKAPLLSQTPLRFFHGALDTSVPTECSREMYDAISKVEGNRCSYNEFTDEGHGIWDRVYSNEENIKWLFSQKKAPVRVTPDDKKKIGIIGAAVAGIAGIITAAAVIGRKKRKK